MAIEDLSSESMKIQDFTAEKAKKEKIFFNPVDYTEIKGWSTFRDRNKELANFKYSDYYFIRLISEAESNKIDHPENIARKLPTEMDRMIRSEAWAQVTLLKKTYLLLDSEKAASIGMEEKQVDFYIGQLESDFENQMMTNFVLMLASLRVAYFKDYNEKFKKYYEDNKEKIISYVKKEESKSTKIPLLAALRELDSESYDTFFAYLDLNSFKEVLLKITSSVMVLNTIAREIANLRILAAKKIEVSEKGLRIYDQLEDFDQKEPMPTERNY